MGVSALPYPFLTGVATFQTLKELVSFVDEEIEIYKKLIDVFGDKLGRLLRAGDGSTVKISGSRSTKNPRELAGWTRFGDLLVQKGESSKAEAEMYFESTEQLKTRLARLGKVKETISKLTDVEPENRTVYIVYLREGVPERVLLRNKNEIEKFSFQNEFLVQ